MAITEVKYLKIEQVQYYRHLLEVVEDAILSIMLKCTFAKIWK